MSSCMGGGVECSDEVSSTLMMGGVKPGGEDEVERWLLRTWSMWPLIIGGEKGACLRICLEGKFGHYLMVDGPYINARAMCESWIG